MESGNQQNGSDPQPESAAEQTTESGGERTESVSDAPSFSIVSVISRSCNMFSKNVWFYWALMLLAMSPSMFFVFGVSSQIGAVAVVAAKKVLEVMGQACVAYTVFQLAVGNKPTFGKVLSKGFSRLATILLTAIAVGVSTAIGSVFFIIPGLIISCLFFVAIPVCVVERQGVLYSLARSVDLTEGCRLKLFVIALIVGFMLQISEMLGAVVANAAISIAILPFLLNIVFSSLPAAFAAVIVAVCYQELRSIKEGFSVESLAIVFD